MSIVLVAILFAIADSACLMVNDFNRDALGVQVSFSTIGEMYGDDNSISSGGVFRLEAGQLVVQPPAQKASYWFMEFEPHCIVPSSNPVRSGNRAYGSFGNFVSLVFDLQASPGADATLSISGGDFVQCDTGKFVSNQISLSSRHRPDGQMHTISIPLSAWDGNQLTTASGLHSLAFSFAPNPSNAVFRFDNVRLCDAGSSAPSPSPIPMASQAPASVAPGRQAPQQQPSPQPSPQPGASEPSKEPAQEAHSSKTTDNGMTSSTLSFFRISSLTIFAIVAVYLIIL